MARRFGPGKHARKRKHPRCGSLRTGGFWIPGLCGGLPSDLFEDQLRAVDLVGDHAVLVLDAPDVGGDLVDDVDLAVLVVADLDLEIDQLQIHGAELPLQDLAHLLHEAQTFVVHAGLQHALHQAETLGDQGIALFVVLQGDFFIRRIEGDAFRQGEPAAHAARGEIAQHELELRHRELLHLHEAVVDVGAEVVRGNAVLRHDLKEILRNAEPDLALAFHAAADGVVTGVEHAVFTGRGVLEQKVHNAGLFVEQDGLGLAVV